MGALKRAALDADEKRDAERRRRRPVPTNRELPFGMAEGSRERQSEVQAAVRRLMESRR
jgi:hypothetical protein